MKRLSFTNPATPFIIKVDHLQFDCFPSSAYHSQFPDERSRSKTCLSFCLPKETKVPRKDDEDMQTTLIDSTTFPFQMLNCQNQFLVPSSNISKMLLKAKTLNSLSFLHKISALSNIGKMVFTPIIGSEINKPSREKKRSAC